MPNSSLLVVKVRFFMGVRVPPSSFFRLSNSGKRRLH